MKFVDLFYRFKEDHCFREKLSLSEFFNRALDACKFYARERMEDDMGKISKPLVTKILPKSSTLNSAIALTENNRIYNSNLTFSVGEFYGRIFPKNENFMWIHCLKMVNLILPFHEINFESRIPIPESNLNMESFDEYYLVNQFAIVIVSLRDPTDIVCTCRTYLKEKICIHFVAMEIELGVLPKQIVPIPQKKKRGRRKKVKSWTRDPNEFPAVDSLSISPEEESFDYDEDRVVFRTAEGLEITTFD